MAALMRTGIVSGRKNTGYTGAWRVALSKDIAGFIGFHPRFEDVRVGFVSDGQEKSVYSNVVMLLVGFSFAFYHVYAFHSVFAEQAFCVVFE